MTRGSARLRHDLLAMGEEKFTDLICTNGSLLVKCENEFLAKMINHTVVPRPCQTFPCICCTGTLMSYCSLYVWSWQYLHSCSYLVDLPFLRHSQACKTLWTRSVSELCLHMHKHRSASHTGTVFFVNVNWLDPF